LRKQWGKTPHLSFSFFLLFKPTKKDKYKYKYKSTSCAKRAKRANKAQKEKNNNFRRYS